MFKMLIPFTPQFQRILSSYDFPLASGDSVKVRETHPNTKDSEKAGKRGKVVGIMQMITVQFEDGSVETYNRDEISIRIPGLDDDSPSEPWKG